jgi:hypothetical protein
LSRAEVADNVGAAALEALVQSVRARGVGVKMIQPT